MPRKLADKEKSFLKELHAVPSINSGAAVQDGDGRILNIICDDFIVEIKCTEAKSYSLKKETWDKIKHEANRLLCDPMMGIDISGTRLVVLDVNDFIELLDMVEEQK